MMFITAFLAHCAVLCLLILALLTGDAHPLERAYGLGWDPALLAMKQQMVVERYAREQRLHEEGRLADGLWRKLQRQLQERYIVIARRLEMLEARENTSWTQKRGRRIKGEPS